MIYFSLTFLIGHATLTKLFDGEPDHLVPLASKVLADSDLFTMAGRMISHSFLHGGPILSGLSPALVNVLTGGTQESTMAMLTLQDCPDIDHRETIQLVSYMTEQFSTQCNVSFWIDRVFYLTILSYSCQVMEN